MSDSIKWVWLNGKWTEVVIIQVSGFRVKYLDLETKEEHTFPYGIEMFDACPSNNPLPRGGDKIKLIIDRVLMLHDTIERGYLPEEFDWDDIETMYSSGAQPQYYVREKYGFDNEYICTYCEEYSIGRGEVEDHSCQGCGHHEWRIWDDKPEIIIRTKDK